jgi:hypothetical protein
VLRAGLSGGESLCPFRPPSSPPSLPVWSVDGGRSVGRACRSRWSGAGVETSAVGRLRLGRSVRSVGRSDRSVGRSGRSDGRSVGRRSRRSGAVGRSSRSVGVVRKGPLSELATTSDRASRNGHRGRERGGPLESVERRSCDGRCALVVSAVCPCPSCRSIYAISAKVAPQPSSLTWSAPQVVRHECRPPRANVRLGRTTRAPCTSNCRLTMPLVSLSLSPVAHIMQPAQSRRRSRGRST